MLHRGGAGLCRVGDDDGDVDDNGDDSSNDDMTTTMTMATMTKDDVFAQVFIVSYTPNYGS